MQPLAAEDGGRHGSQPVPAQVQLLQLLQSGQFTAQKLRVGLEARRFILVVSIRILPGGKRLQLVVGDVQHPEAAVSRQQWDAFIRQAVVGHVELLQAADGVLRQAGCRELLQLVGRHVQVA